jgi:hypothetical protein
MWTFAAGTGPDRRSRMKLSPPYDEPAPIACTISEAEIPRRIESSSARVLDSRVHSLPVGAVSSAGSAPDERSMSRICQGNSHRRAPTSADETVSPDLEGASDLRSHGLRTDHRRREQTPGIGLITRRSQVQILPPPPFAQFRGPFLQTGEGLFWCSGSLLNGARRSPLDRRARRHAAEPSSGSRPAAWR